MLLWLVHTSCPGSDVVDVLRSSPFEAVRLVWLGYLRVVSSISDTPSVQHVKTCKVKTLACFLIITVILQIFLTTSDTTRHIGEYWVIDFKIFGLLEKAHWWQERDGEYRSRGVDIVTDELWNLTDNRAPQQIYHDIHTRSVEHMHMIAAPIVYVIELSEPLHSGGMSSKSWNSDTAKHDCIW